MPEKFRQNISGLHAEKGVRWLENLPCLAAEISEKWSLAVENPFPDESQNLRKWAFAEAVLSAWWKIEDGGADAEKWLACAEIWET